MGRLRAHVAAKPSPKILACVLVATALAVCTILGACTNTDAASTARPEPSGSSEFAQNPADLSDERPDRESGGTVVCLGDSITSGNVPTYSEPDPWPTFLQQIIDENGGAWTVTNLGVSSTTLLDGGNYPYRSTGNIAVAQGIAPEMAIVMLGTNDSFDPAYDADTFKAELESLVDELRSVRDDMQIVLMAPPSVFCDPDPYGAGVFHMNDVIIGEQIGPIVRETAAEKGAGFVDLHAMSASHPEWFPDTVHPNGEGNRAIAAYVYEHVFS